MPIFNRNARVPDMSPWKTQHEAEIELLRHVIEDHAKALFGEPVPPAWRDRFPLLVKIIDAADDLSVQVHPRASYIAEHGIRDSAKTESWVILDAEPGSRLITGVRPGTDPHAFRRAAEQGALDDLLVAQEVEAGDVVWR